MFRSELSQEFDKAARELEQVRRDTHADRPTVWGLTPSDLHDRFWAARGVQVIRPAEPGQVSPGAELYLLTSSQSLVIFKLRQVVDLLSWLKPRILPLKLLDTRELGYREIAILDERFQFQGFQRRYNGTDLRRTQLALTADADLAALWQEAADSNSGWRTLRENLPEELQFTNSISGRVHDVLKADESMLCVRELIQSWSQPDSTIRRVRKVSGDVWADKEAEIGGNAKFVGPVWIGAGRRVESEMSVVGPAVLWDDPNSRPSREPVRWHEVGPRSQVRTQLAARRKAKPLGPPGKRLFDIFFSLVMLALTLPLYPLVMLAILIEDGRPFFFVHRRQTAGGRSFPCLKFRTMRQDAEKLKAQLAKENQADGPQFYINKDPRLLRVGRFIRDLKIDEWPQCFNVLLGHMSVVGPRPSPFEENQFCPAWQEARLSVRAGITGLWQVMRTRRRGLDFQEWIKYDIEYVENISWRLDLWILWRTIYIVLSRR